MKKTEYIVTTCFSMSTQNTTRRVYVDDAGKRYIKTKDGYKCIENTPCINTMIKERR